MITGILRGGYCGAVVCIAACAAAACDVGNGDPQSFADRPQSTEVRVTMLNAERESRTVFDYDLGDRPRARLGLAPPLGNRSVTFLLQASGLTHARKTSSRTRRAVPRLCYRACASAPFARRPTSWVMPRAPAPRPTGSISGSIRPSADSGRLSCGAVACRSRLGSRFSGASRTITGVMSSSRTDPPAPSCDGPPPEPSSGRLRKTGWTAHGAPGSRSSCAHAG
jgi:hypothetical protein